MATPGFFGFLLIVGRSWGLVASSGRFGGACDGGLAATGMAGEDATIDDEVDARRLGRPAASPRAGRAAEASPRAGLGLTVRSGLGQKGS